MNKEKEQFLENLQKLVDRTDKVYIYGAGLFGRNIYSFIEQKGIPIAGFIVTKRDDEKGLENAPIVEAKDILGSNIGIIIGVNRRNEIEIIQVLEEYNFNMQNVIYGNSLMDNQGKREGYDGKPVIEITTQIGCRVNCLYCPQTLLLNRYFGENKNRKMVMEFEVFKKCVEKVPEDALIRFCGMAEPFLNSECIKMMKFACSAGKKVDLFTTLVGLQKEDLDTLINLPIEWVNVHVADCKGYANIPLNENYYEILSLLVDAQKINGEPFINVLSAQAAPDKKVLEICGDKYITYSTLTDRAGNLEDSDKLIAKRNVKGKISCSLCGQDLNHNILLPDGTLLLCCMDYGMKHPLGNLMEMTYEEIMKGSEVTRIRRGMHDLVKEDILCRSCSYASGNESV